MPLDESPQAQYIVDVVLDCAVGSVVSKERSSGGTSILPPVPGEKSEPLVVPVLLSTICSLSHIRIFLPKDLRPLEGRKAVFKAVSEVKKRFPEGIALLDPIENMGIKDDSFKSLVKVGDQSTRATLPHLQRSFIRLHALLAENPDARETPLLLATPLLPEAQ